MSHSATELTIQRIKNESADKTVSPVIPREGMLGQDSGGIYRNISVNASGEWIIDPTNLDTRYAKLDLTNQPFKPLVDSTTAFQIQQADTTPVFNVDTTNGRVGIGTTNPGAKLHTLSTSEQLRIGYDAANYAKFMVLSNGDLNFGSTSGIFNLYDGSTAFDFRVYNGATQAINLRGSGNSWLNGGNVGIGTTSPNNLLQVNDLISFTNADWRTQIGYQAGKYDLGQYNTWIGYQAGSANNSTGKTDAADYNTAVGYQALYSNTTGSNNSAQGNAALHSNTTGIRNSAQGYAALRYNTTGSYNSAQGMYALYSNTTGSYNSAQGVYALYSNTTGIRNSAQGYAALHSNKSISSYRSYSPSI